MKDLVILSSGSTFLEQQLKQGPFRDEFDVLDLYDVTHCNLEPYAGMFVPGSIDQEFLLKESDRVRQFLDKGKVLVFSGQLFRFWLPGGKPFVPKEIRSHHDYAVTIQKPHPIFDGVKEEDLTFRKGVSGFFARGYHPVPEGAEVLLTLAGGEPIVYMDRKSTRGTILVHAGGTDLLSYHNMNNTSSRMGPQLLRWIRHEHCKLQERGGKDEE